MSSYKDADKNILDRYGRRSGLERRIAKTDSFPFERRKSEDRRENKSDRRKSLPDRFRNH